MNDCLFCKIVTGEIPAHITFSDDQLVVFKDIHPRAPIHLLIVPRAHLESLEGLQPEHDALMGKIMRMLPRFAHDQGLANGFRTVINTGPEGGQEIGHLHLHLFGGNPLPAS